MRRHLVFVAAALLLGCAQPGGTGGEPGEFETGRGFTLVNLHPDNRKSKLYAVNYQQAGLIPVCSEVEYLFLRRKTMRFRVISTSRKYLYVNHRAAAEPFRDHLRRFFGPSCPRQEIDALPDLDRQGIRQGRAMLGMTRTGVIFAIGHPPRHVNLDANGPTLTWWRGRFDQIFIEFGPADTVTAIHE